MKNKYINVPLFIFATILGSCSNELSDTMACNNEVANNDDGNVIIFNRNPLLPFAKTRMCLPFNTRANVIDKGNSDELLGYGYKYLNGNYILGDLKNVGFPIINLDAIKEYDPTYVSSVNLNTNETRIDAYDTYNSYKFNSTITKKVSSGFSLNVKLFSIGKKKTTTETFKTVIDSLDEATFGELNLLFIDNQFSIQNSEGARRLFSRQFLTKSFVRSLYNSTVQSTLDNYGEFVLTSYLTGGKAFAAYAGHNSDYKTSELREKGIEKAITASLTYKGSKGSGELGLSSGNSTSSSSNFKSEDTYIYVKTFGGNRDGSEAEVKARTLKDLNINLTPWLHSLNKDNNTIIDIADNSLFPLSDFVLEKNFKQRLDDTANGVLPSFNNFVTPYIVLERVMIRSTSSYEGLYDILPVLITRQGDRIIFMDGIKKTDEELRKNNDDNTFMEKVSQLSNNRMSMFSSEIDLDYNKKVRINPMFRNPLCIEIDNFNKSNFYRFYYQKTGIEYIYNPQTHIAFSFYIDEDDDEVLDIYGIRNWVESMPERKTSIASIANNYNIIGL